MITFCRTRYTYDSYVDFWRLVELAGFRTIYIDEIPRDAPGQVFVVTPINGEWKHGIVTTGRVVWWQLEWGLGDGAPHGTDEIWTSDRYHAQEIGARFVPLGSHPALVTVNPSMRWRQPQYDVCLLAYMGPHRRQHVIPELEARQMRVAPNAWGRERELVLQNSRCMVNVHQHDEWPCVPVQRFALAAAAAIPLVSEVIRDPFPYVADEDFLSVPYEDVIGVAASLVKGSNGRGLAARMFDKACNQFRFEKNVLKALEGVEV